MSRAAYMRDYRKESRERERKKAFVAGFQALRVNLMGQFKRIGKGEMNGFTAFEIVRNTEPDVPRGT